MFCGNIVIEKHLPVHVQIFNEDSGWHIDSIEPKKYYTNYQADGYGNAILAVISKV